MKSLALIVAGIVFAIVTALHLYRLYYQLPVTIDGTEVPLWWNGVGALVAGLLSAWMFSSASCRHHHHGKDCGCCHHKDDRTER